MSRDEQATPKVCISDYESAELAKVSEILDSYLRALEAGERPDETKLIATNPDVADLLQAQFDNLRMLHQAVDTPASHETRAFYAAPHSLGNYDLHREIGRGGMGIVYEATDRTLHRQVALKVLPFAAVLDRKQIERFRNEARAAAQLKHPNIVPVFSVGADRGVHFYAMQFIEGRPLSVAIEEQRAASRDNNDSGALLGQLTDVHGGSTQAYCPPKVREAANTCKSVSHSVTPKHETSFPRRRKSTNPPNETKPNNSAERLDSRLRGNDGKRLDSRLRGNDVNGSKSAKPWDTQSLGARPPAQDLDGSHETHRSRDTQRCTAESTRRKQTKKASSDYFTTCARLGREAAEGLQHAHDFGIVHRDIKPSNLLLDDSGKLWIADFGLAHIPNDVSMTASGDVLGTVRYMSPEQAAGNGFVDHRTDIYSLGLTLYEMLTLRAAFPSQRRHQLLQQITTEPPAMRSLNRHIPLDLETIVLKAIAKEPSDRYASAQMMAEDLQRFLDGRPTLAQRPTLLDRLSKWTRRHRRAVAMATSLLILATVLSVVAAIKFGTAKQRLSKALARAEQKELESQENLKAVRASVDRLGVHVSEELKSVPGSGALRYQLLSETLDIYEFILNQSSDPTLRQDHTLALTKAARITEELGDDDQALEYYSQARTTLQELIAATPDNGQLRREYGRCLNNEGVIHRRRGDTSEALQKIDLALAVYDELSIPAQELVDDLAAAWANRAVVLDQLGDKASSRASYAEAIRQLRDAYARQPKNRQRAKHLSFCLNNLATALAETDPDLAMTYCQEAIALQKKLADEPAADLIAIRSDLALSYSNLGRLQALVEDRDSARGSYQRSIQIGRRLTELSPGVPQFRCDLAISWNDLGRLELHAGHWETALAAFQSAAQIMEPMVKQSPEQTVYLAHLAAVQFHQGLALHELGRLDEARELCEFGLQNYERVTAAAPDEPLFRKNLQVQRQEYMKRFPSSSKPGSLVNNRTLEVGDSDE